MRTTRIIAVALATCAALTPALASAQTRYYGRERMVGVAPAATPTSTPTPTPVGTTIACTGTPDTHVSTNTVAVEYVSAASITSVASAIAYCEGKTATHPYY